MIFINKKHNSIIYNTLLTLSRNIFFYQNLVLDDSYETRVYLMFFHYSIILLILKKRKIKADQENYDNLFFYLENNLRESGLGDVTVNKKMKDLNKIFYDILLKINSDPENFKINKKLCINYFNKLKNNNEKWVKIEQYFDNFYNFCFDMPIKNVLKEAVKFKF